MGSINSNTTDGNQVSGYLYEMSSKAKTVGRSVVFSIIATTWTLSYSYGMFIPTLYIKWSLGLALIYLFLDLLYYFLMTTVYKYILLNYFEPNDEEGFVNKEGKNATRCTKWWMKFGFVWLIFMLLLLLVSSIFLILEVLQLEIV